MKKFKSLLLLFLVVFTTSIFAQNNSVGIGTTTPDNSAILDLVSTNQGLLIPRNNTSGITTITAPSDGLILYNTDDKCYWFWNNSAWKRLCETDSLLTMINNLGDTIGFIYDSLAVHNTNISNLTTIVNNHSDSIDWIYDSLAVHNTNIFNNTSNINNLYDSVDVINNYLGLIDSTLLEKWDLNGNTIVNGKFIGTLNNQDFVIKTNNIEKARVTSVGNIGVGTTTPDNSAILDLVSTNQGFLIPRNNTSGITTITAPSDGLILYNTDDKCYWFWNNSAWKRLCETDSLLTMINNLGDTIGFIYDSLAVHNTNISNLTTIVNNHSDSLDWIYDSLAVHNTNIFNNTSNINNLYDSVDVINNSITNLTNIINNHSDSLDWIYDSLAVHNTNITNNTNNINNLYDSLTVYNNLVNTNITNISNLYDSVDVINTHLGVVDSTLLNKWDIYGNVGTNPTTNFLGTIDNQHLVFRTNNTEKVRVTTTGRLGIGTNNPTQLLDINSNALRLRTGATNNFVLTTDATGVGTWKDPSINPLLTGNYWTTSGNTGLNSSTNWVGTNDAVDFVLRGHNMEAMRIQSWGTRGVRIGVNLQYRYYAGVLTPLTIPRGTFDVYGHNFIFESPNISGMGVGTGPIVGEGRFMMFNSEKGAFRAGRALTNEWDNANVGTLSQSLGMGNLVQAGVGVAFGQQNVISTTAGNGFAIGSYNTINGAFSFGVGSGVTTTLFNEWVSRFSNGYTLYSNAALSTGVYLAPGSGTWASVSDRNLKTNITKLDYNEVLEKYKNLDVSKWSYISQTINGQEKIIKIKDINGKDSTIEKGNLYVKDIYHIGVMAQDFYKEFNLGTSDKLITALDVAGVNMAAIKGLIEENEILKSRLEKIETQLNELLSR